MGRNISINILSMLHSLGIRGLLRLSTPKGCLNNRGIEIIPALLREQAAAVLKLYSSSDGALYNGGENRLASELK